MATDKMMMRKEDGIGWMIFNNPERHNAVSLEMWEAGAPRSSRTSPAIDTVRVIVVRGRGRARPSSPAPTSRNSTASAPRRPRRPL